MFIMRIYYGWLFSNALMFLSFEGMQSLAFNILWIILSTLSLCTVELREQMRREKDGKREKSERKRKQFWPLGEVELECVLNEPVAARTNDESRPRLEAAIQHHVCCHSARMQGHLKYTQHNTPVMLVTHMGS